MNWSYWEIKTWLSDIDFTIIGSGIVGLSCALHLKQRYPESKILVLEKGILPQGASTKNAGFACFGSMSEILSDLNAHTEQEVLELIQKRVDGLHLLRSTLGDKSIGYNNFGGFELFLDSDKMLYERCLEKQEYINKLLKPLFKADVFSWQPNRFGFGDVKPLLGYNQFEGQIDTGKMMASLLRKVQNLGIKIINSCSVESFTEDSNAVKIKTEGFEFSSKQLLIATNGFTNQLFEVPVKPARAQVVITKPINDLTIKGTFHLDQGYYYFRNIDKRILLGGGRNLDFKSEETTRFGFTNGVQEKLYQLLESTILPDHDFEIEYRWSGIMGIGHQKKAIVKQLSDHVYCGVRLGGMGVAIGSLVGRELADLAS